MMRAYAELLKIGESFGCRDALREWFLDSVEVLVAKSMIPKPEVVSIYGDDYDIYSEAHRKSAISRIAEELVEKCPITEEDSGSDTHYTHKTFRAYILKDSLKDVAA